MGELNQHNEAGVQARCQTLVFHSSRAYNIFEAQQSSFPAAKCVFLHILSRHYGCKDCQPLGPLFWLWALSSRLPRLWMSSTCGHILKAMVSMMDALYDGRLVLFLQRQLGEMRCSSQMRIHQREKEAQELRQAIFSLTVSATQCQLQGRAKKLFVYHVFPPSSSEIFHVCVPPALRSGRGGGERRRVRRTHPVDRAEALRGEGADQSPGEDGHQSGRAAAREGPQGDR